MKTLKTLTLTALALLCAGAVLAETPLQWGANLGRNAIVPAKDLPSHLGEDNQLWQIDLAGKPFFNAIQIDGDRAYAGMDARNLPDRGRDRVGGLLCFNIHTGEILWQTILEDMKAEGYGASIVPLLEGDRIYLAVGSKAACLDRDGNVLWQQTMRNPYFSTMHGTHGSGLLLGDYWWVVTGHANGSDCEFWASNAIERPFHPNIMVLDKETGEIVAQDDVIVGPHQHGNWCSLSYGEVNGQGMVFWGDAFGLVHAYKVPEKFDAPEGQRATIEHLWSIDANPESYRYTEEGVRLPYAYYMGFWGPKGSGPCEIISPVVFHEGKIYITLSRDIAYYHEGGEGGLICYDVTGPEPKLVWQNLDVQRTFCPPSIAGDKIFIADHGGQMTGIDLASGETLWQQSMNDGIWNYFQCWGDDKIYVANQRRDFMIFEADEDGGLLFNTIMDTANNPQVGMTHGLLIVPTMKSIAAYGGPEYMKTAQPMAAPEDPDDRQFGHGEPGEFDARKGKGH